VLDVIDSPVVLDVIERSDRDLGAFCDSGQREVSLVPQAADAMAERLGGDVRKVAPTGCEARVLGVRSFPTTTSGFVALHDWLCAFGPIRQVGVEGTGAYGAGLSRYLQSLGLVVIEVDRTNRQVRRMQGKSDPVDAIEAARAALSGRASGIAKTADGNVEAIRALLIAQRSGRQARVRCLNQIHHLGFTSPDALREQFRDVP
jgi:transposase